MSADNWTTCPKPGCGGEFREEWEIGVYEGDGTFFVDYRGQCRDCRGRIDFTHEVPALSVFKDGPS